MTAWTESHCGAQSKATTSFNMNTWLQWDMLTQLLSSPAVILNYTMKLFLRKFAVNINSLNCPKSTVSDRCGHIKSRGVDSLACSL